MFSSDEELGRFSEALDAWKEAARLDPDDSDIQKQHHTCQAKAAGKPKYRKRRRTGGDATNAVKTEANQRKPSSSNTLGPGNRITLRPVSVKVEQAASKFLLQRGVYGNEFGEIAEAAYLQFMNEMWLDAT